MAKGVQEVVSGSPERRSREDVVRGCHEGVPEVRKEVIRGLEGNLREAVLKGL